MIVNDEAVGVLPNTVKFNEGFGEQKMRAVSVGEGQVEQVYSEDVETAFGSVSFEIPTTIANVALARSWKANKNRNVVSVVGTAGGETLTRTFQQAGLLGNYDVEIGSETSIALEFSANAPI
jgi:hypothetical protein